MSAPPVEYVVDASVGIKLFVDEPGSAAAVTLFAQLAADPPARLYVPDLFYVECANILWKYVGRYAYPQADAARAVQNLHALQLAVIATRHLMEDAWPIAVDHNVTAYDACYVALARALNVPLVTADDRLAQAMRGTAYRVERLAGIAEP